MLTSAGGRFDLFLRDRIRKEFRSGQPLDLEKAKAELKALQNLLQGGVEAKWGLGEASRIMAYLPPPKTFELLDQEAQQALERSRSPFSVITSLVTGQERLRN